MTKFNFIKFVLGAGCVLLTSISYAQPSRDLLNEITARGRLLNEYDKASWIGTDVVLASKPDKALVKRYIARQIGNDWEVVFGKINERKDAFVVNYKYTNNLELAKKHKLPYEDSDFYFKSAMAIEKAFTAFNKVNTYKRPFNIAILPKADNYYVYFYPASVKKDVYLLGGDWRYLVSGKTFEILETRQLHKTIMKTEPLKTGTLESGFHVAVLDGIPEDTDVMYVLMRKPSVPEYIPTKSYMYKIQTDGTIECLGLSKDVLGDGT